MPCDAGREQGAYGLLVRSRRPPPDPGQGPGARRPPPAAWSPGGRRSPPSSPRRRGRAPPRRRCRYRLRSRPQPALPRFLLDAYVMMSPCRLPLSGPVWWLASSVRPSPQRATTSPWGPGTPNRPERVREEWPVDRLRAQQRPAAGRVRRPAGRGLPQRHQRRRLTGGAAGGRPGPARQGGHRRLQPARPQPRVPTVAVRLQHRLAGRAAAAGTARGPAGQDVQHHGPRGDGRPRRPRVRSRRSSWPATTPRPGRPRPTSPRELGWVDVLDLGDLTAARGLEMYIPLWLRIYGAVGQPLFNIKVVR